MATGILRGIWDEALWDLIKGVLGGVTQGFSGRIQEAIKKSPRHDLVYTLLMMEPQDRTNLMEAFREYIRQGRENRMVRELGKALPRTPEGKLDEERARRLLKELNSVPEDELQMFMEFLNYDPVAQWFRHWVLGKGQEAAVKTVEVLAELAGHGIHLMEQIPWPEADEVRVRLKAADNSINDAILGWRSRGRWWLRRSRKRQRQLQGHLDVRNERLRQEKEMAVRERVAEVYDRLRSERGGRQ